MQYKFKWNVNEGDRLYMRWKDYDPEKFAGDMRWTDVQEKDVIEALNALKVGQTLDVGVLEDDEYGVQGDELDDMIRDMLQAGQQKFLYEQQPSRYRVAWGIRRVLESSAFENCIGVATTFGQLREHRNQALGLIRSVIEQDEAVENGYAAWVVGSVYRFQRNARRQIEWEAMDSYFSFYLIVMGRKDETEANERDLCEAFDEMAGYMGDPPVVNGLAEYLATFA